jgi:hypothetical protein
VDLTFTVDKGIIQATAPANGNVAPPGYYMLVIVSSNGVPSVMPFLQLSASTTSAERQKGSVPAQAKK